MSEEEVTFSPQRVLQSSPESQNILRVDATQKPRKADGKEFSVPWHLITVTLWFRCLLLLVVIGLLLIKGKSRKCPSKVHILKKNNSLLEQLLTNKSLECDNSKITTFQPKKELGSFSIKKKSCDKNNAASKSLENAIGKLCGHWSCHGVKCYYFVMEFKDWKECKQMCQSHRLSLLKIDDYNELNFLQSQIYPDYYWIGLSYDSGEGKWKWTDGGTSEIFAHFQMEVIGKNKMNK
uniref:C-type lectin domain-containing protein n=1 Tax=Castor canadensis TaxID=51338 RepID=A0A8C0XVS9_CASCN